MLAPRSPLAVWTVVMPVKALSAAKTRIDPERGGAGGVLARAFFLDTAAAAVGCPRVARVVVATNDPTIADDATAPGCEVVDDTGHRGINAAARWAVQHAQVRGPVAVIVSDLPCLTPDALAIVLDAALRRPTAFLADADGSGTTMWFATDGALDSHFGPDSAEAHRRGGAFDLVSNEAAVAAADTARRDVDTELDLAAAVALGVGPHTVAAMEKTSGPLLLTALGRGPDGSVAVVDENGGRHRVEWPAMAAAGFREVRPGQRLVIEASGRVRLP